MTNKTINEIMETANGEVARAQKRIGMHKRFQELMSFSDSENRLNVIDKESGGPCRNVLFDELSGYLTGCSNLRKHEGVRSWTEVGRGLKLLENHVYSLIHSIWDRTMKEDTYLGIINGTDPVLAPYQGVRIL